MPHYGTFAPPLPPNPQMDARVITERIARMEWIDTFATPLQEGLAYVFERTGKVGAKVREFLNGKFLGHPLHPATVHLPLGAWTLAALLDPWGGSMAARMGADLAIAIGTVAALLTSLTGAADYYTYGDASIRRLGGLHALLNTMAILLYVLSWMGRHDGMRDFARVFSYLGFGTVMVSGFLGGLLVYEKRIGTNHAPLEEDETAADDWQPVVHFDDLIENVPFRANVGDIPVVLVRQANRVHALAAACSHQGGPLDEGKVEGKCIECPWHQTRFNLETGEAESGVGVFAQPRYETRLIEGMVEVDTRPKSVDVTTPFGNASLR